MRLPLCTALLALALCQPALAQDAAPETTTEDAPKTAGLMISLNALESTDNGCKLTFLVENDLPADIESLQAEVALFDSEGVVDRLTMLDFLTLPEGKKRVRQFELPGASCDALGGLLLNDIKVCDAEGVDCMGALETGSKADIPFDG